MKNYYKRIHDLRQELTGEIIERLQNLKHKFIIIPDRDDYEDGTFVMWVDDDGEAFDGRVTKMSLYNDECFSVEVEDNWGNSTTLYSGVDIGCNHVEWLESMLSMLIAFIDGGDWNICPECGKPTLKGNESNKPSESYCSDECRNKAKIPQEKQSDEIGIVIGRPINGITINGLEYIFDDAGAVMHFLDMKSARTHLTQHGIDPDQEDLHYLYHTYCLNCGEEYFLREDETFTDESGRGYLCGKCGSSFDII